MNKIIIIAVLMSLMACSKTEVKTEINEDIIGTWAWSLTSGGIAGVELTPENTNNGIELIFTPTHVSTFINGELDTKKTYQIKVISSTPQNEEHYEIVIDNNSQSLSIKDTHMTIADLYYDGFQWDYDQKK